MKAAGALRAGRAVAPRMMKRFGVKTLGGGSGEAGEESSEIKKDMQNIRQEGMKSSVNEYTLQGNWNTARVRFV